MFQFQHIEYFLILLALPVFIFLFFLLLRWKKNAIKKIGDESLVKQLIKGFSSKLFALKFILILIAFTLCAFAAADLVQPDGSRQIKRNGIDVMIALDVSKSMLAEDIKPNRLERAKQIVSKVIDKLSDDKVGIVIFAGRAYLQMPLTTDHSAAKMYLSSASPDDVPAQGTVISQALKMCYAAFNTKEKKYRSIILISDGEDHDEDAIKITKELSQEGVMVNTIGIGSPQGAPIMDKETNEYKKDENGVTVISKLNEDALKEIAQNGKGLYQLFSSADEVANNLNNQLASIGTGTITDSTFAVYKNYFWYFLLAAFIFLLAENFIYEKDNQCNRTFIITINISCKFYRCTNA
jgi:Ca-activated chloride channel family protein